MLAARLSHQPVCLPFLKVARNKTMRVVKHWPRLPREVGDVSSLETFKAGLDGALSNLIQWKMPMAGGLE